MPPSPLERLASLAIWSRLDEIVAEDLSALIGDALTTSSFACPSIAVASEIPLTFAAERIQLRLGLGIDQTATVALQQVLLGGDAEPDALADAMRELANTAGGAIKRAALGSGAELTIGLPSNTNILVAPAPTERREWTLASSGGLAFACVTHVSARTPVLVVARDLREKMVLTRDVRDPMGLLVAPAGTNLTRTTVEQLARLLGPSATVEVDDLMEACR